MARSLGKVHIAFDGWTLYNRHSFFAVNAQYLNDKTFEPRKMLLSMPHIPGNHTGLNVAAKITEILKEFGLIKQLGKVGYFILDNAGNNGIAIIEFASLLYDLDTNNAP